MRVTEGMIANKYLFSHKQITDKQMKIQTQLANNSRIETLSDDVAGSLDAINVNTQRKRTDAYLKNVQNANGFVKASMNSLDRTIEEIQKITTSATSANNQMINQSYGTIAQSIKDNLNSIVQSINDKYNGMYLFGGTDFSGDPVSIDANGKAVISATDHSGEIKVQISSNTKETMNIPGDKITGSGIFQAVNDIIDSLVGGAQPTGAQLDALTAANNKLLNVQSLAGEKVNRLDSMETILTNQNTNYEELLSKIQGIDPAKLSVELQEQDYLLQVSYKLLANSFPKSVFDYL